MLQTKTPPGDKGASSATGDEFSKKETFSVKPVVTKKKIEIRNGRPGIFLVTVGRPETSQTTSRSMILIEVKTS